MQIKKFVGIFFAAIVLILGFWWVGSACYQAWNGYRWQKQTDAFMEAGRKPYKDDTYGGKTPEETWTMFLDALKKGDVELASKYFVVEKQKEELDFLKNEKSLDELKLLLSQVTNQIRKDDVNSNNNKAYYNYSFIVSGNVKTTNTAVFVKNNYTGIWKISVL